MLLLTSFNKYLEHVVLRYIQLSDACMDSGVKIQGKVVVFSRELLEPESVTGLGSGLNTIIASLAIDVVCVSSVGQLARQLQTWNENCEKQPDTVYVVAIWGLLHQFEEYYIGNIQESNTASEVASETERVTVSYKLSKKQYSVAYLSFVFMLLHQLGAFADFSEDLNLILGESKTIDLQTKIPLTPQSHESRNKLASASTDWITLQPFIARWHKISYL